MKKKTPKGIDAPTLNYLISGLLVLTAILHLGAGALMGESELKVPILVFGVLFLGAGVWVRKGGRPAVLGVMGLSALGLALGGSKYLQQGGPVSMPLMFLIDVLVIAAGAAWLNLTRKKKA
ncbi:MAG: hypothetical protein VX640_14830 [Pseudomonadota bacterium]|nr:hypothetical protein [Pseudomonadota bacterium]